MADLSAQAASIVRRARVGDQNAMALIKQVGKAAREGTSKRAMKAYALLQKYINKNPAEDRGGNGASSGGLFGFGGEIAALPAAPSAGLVVDETSAPVAQGASGPGASGRGLPSLPRGAFDRLSIENPDAMQRVILT